jgi:hypothetical protein
VNRAAAAVDRRQAAADQGHAAILPQLETLARDLGAGKDRGEAPEAAWLVLLGALTAALIELDSFQPVPRDGTLRADRADGDSARAGVSGMDRLAARRRAPLRLFEGARTGARAPGLARRLRRLARGRHGRAVTRDPAPVAARAWRRPDRLDGQPLLAS